MWQLKLYGCSLGILSNNQTDSDQSFSKYLGSVSFLYDVFIILLVLIAGLWGWHCGRQSGLSGGHGLWGWGKKEAAADDPHGD